MASLLATGNGASVPLEKVQQLREDMLDLPFDGGDTQLMDPQVYGDLHPSQKSEGDTSRTGEDEPSGNLDLLEGFPDLDQQHDPYDDLLECEHRDALRPPETPALSSEGTARGGLVVDERTPASCLFRGNSRGLTATQMFAQTQEPSSPYQTLETPSNLILSRPSPTSKSKTDISSPNAQSPLPLLVPKISAQVLPEPRSEYRSARQAAIVAMADTEETFFHGNTDAEDEEDGMATILTQKRHGQNLPHDLAALNAQPRPVSRNLDHPAPVRNTMREIDLTRSTPAAPRRDISAFDELLTSPENPVSVRAGSRVFGDHGIIAEASKCHGALQPHGGVSSVYDSPLTVLTIAHEEGLNHRLFSSPGTPNSIIEDSQRQHTQNDGVTNRIATQQSSTSLIMGTQYAKASHMRPDAASGPYSTNHVPATLDSSPPASAEPPKVKPLYSPAQQSDTATSTNSPSAVPFSFGDFGQLDSARRHCQNTQELVDEVVSKVVTLEDREYLALMNSPSSSEPARKKQKVIHKRKRYPEESLRPAKEFDASAMVQTEHRVDHAEGQMRRFIPTDQLASAKLTEALRDSPSKANKLPPLLTRTAKRTTVAQHSEPTNLTILAQPDTSSHRSLLSSGRPRDTQISVRKNVPVVRDPTMAQSTPKRILTAADRHDDPETSLASHVGWQKVSAIDRPPIVAPDRVLAWFGGKYLKYYSATWLGNNRDNKTYRVRFDDKTELDVIKHQVCRLDFRVGDEIKLETQDPVMKKTIWVIKGFGTVARDNLPLFGATDQRGRATALVVPKSQKEAKEIEVSICDVRIDQSKFKDFYDREFHPPERESTPTSRLLTPELTESGSRARRRNGSSLRLSSNQKGSAKFSMYQPSTSRMFEGMAFGITYGHGGADETEMADIAQRIEAAGGLILAGGFDELFETQTQDTTTTTPTSRLLVKTEFCHLGFVALIAKRYSRSEKYLQSLALGLPALSSRWVLDSLDMKINSGRCSDVETPLSWSKYLLAAGQSSYLDGAVRSRVLVEGPISESKLVHSIAHRPFLLGDDDGVLVVVPRKKKKDRQRQEHMIFLAHVLGARRVQRVTDLESAQEVMDLDSGPWNWIYVYGSVIEAAKSLVGENTGALSRSDRVLDRMTVEVKGQMITVVNDEFVIQSLILGALLG